MDRDKNLAIEGHPHLLFGLSPWLVVGICLVLGLAIVILSVRSSEREKRNLTVNLTERASALIWAVEAGTRTWMDYQGESRLLQQLIQETAKQPGIDYITVIDKNSRVLAHSDPDLVGTLHAREGNAGEAMQTTGGGLTWRTVGQAGFPIFEVRRRFSPMGASENHDNSHMGMGDGHGRGHGRGMWRFREASEPAVSYDSTTIIVGLDKKPYEDALVSDYNSNLLTAGVIAALGLGGFLSLFWAHNYRRSRRMMLDARALSSQVVTNLPLGLLTCGPDGTVEIINAAAHDILKVPRESARGVALQTISGPDWNIIIQSLAGDDKILEQEMEFRVADGARRYVSLSASRLVSEDGEFLGHLFILNDIGEVKRLLGQVERNERLTELGNLAAGAAHEIRNPLSSIKGLATYLSGKVPAGGREEEAAKTMIAEVNRLNHVVSELLEFARPSGNRNALADVADIVRKTLTLAEADVKSKGIVVCFTPPDGFPKTPLNPERFTQALLNLILNAAQAMEYGGILEIMLEESTEYGVYTVSVRDNGGGMTDDIRVSAFKPYFTTKANGTGLGLAIVRQIVGEHGGKITVTSAPGLGSEFTMTLPLARAAR